MNDEIQRIISGESKVRFGTTIQAVLSYLAGSKVASSMAKTGKHYKKQETEELIRYVESQ